MASTADIAKLVKLLLTQGVDGLGPLSSSRELANEFLFDEGYTSTRARIDALIRWETAKNFGTGFITGVGGIATLPVSIPSAVYASYFLQARLAGAVAELRGHSVDEERVRTMVLLCLIGNAGKEILKEAGVRVGGRLALSAIERVPARLLTQINRSVGFRLLSRSGERGVINLTRIVPVAGGVVGGAIDAVACRIAGRAADRVFRGR